MPKPKIFPSLTKIHKKGDCVGFCPFHNPSDHHMKAWDMNVRFDRGCMIERMCPHGVGHPDPDSLTYLNKNGNRDDGIHGCDLCCLPELPDFPGYGITTDGKVYSKKWGKFLKFQKRNGYLDVQLRNRSRVLQTVFIHRLVAKLYIPNPKNKPFVNHLDFNRSNNNITNLEWVTSSENALYTYQHNRRPYQGRIARKNGSLMRKLTKRQVKEIRKLHGMGIKNITLAARFNVHRETISRVIRELTYGT